MVADCLLWMPVWSGVLKEESEPDMVRSVRNIILREDAGLEDMKRAATVDEDYKLLVSAFRQRRLPLECSVNHPVRSYRQYLEQSLDHG